MDDEAGRIIFGTGAGFTIYTPPKVEIPPPIAITKVVADKVYSDFGKTSGQLRNLATSARTLCSNGTENRFKTFFVVLEIG